MLRIAIPAIALVLAGTACSDALGGVGDISRRVVHGDETTMATTTTAASGPVLALSPVTGAAWFNDGLEETTADLETDRLIRMVWLREVRRAQDAEVDPDPFVQASRFEIEEALPGIEFPGLVPEAVSHISSQLVYDPLTATLEVATAAAFGLWSAEPYTAPRTETQLAVLRVGLRTFDAGSEGDFFSFVVADGQEVSWIDGDYVYSLFCRTGVSEAACFAIAESTVPLSLLTVSTSQ